MVARAWSEPDFSFSELANMDPLSSDMLFSRKTSQNRYPGTDDTDHTDHPDHPKINTHPFYGWLVVWNMNFMTFHSVGNVIIPTDELHHFSEG